MLAFLAGCVFKALTGGDLREDLSCMLNALPEALGVPRLCKATASDIRSPCFPCNGQKVVRRPLWDPRATLAAASPAPVLEAMKESPTPPVSSSGDDCTTDGSAVPSASPSNPTSASTSKALVPAGPVVATAPSASCPASEDAPAATCCGEVQAESSSGGDENDDVSSYMQGEVRLVVTFEDGSFRRFSKSVVEDFRKLPLDAFEERHGLQCWRSEGKIGRGGYGLVHVGLLQRPDGTTRPVAAKLFLGGLTKAKEQLNREVGAAMQLQQACATASSSSSSSSSPEQPLPLLAAAERSPFVRLLCHGGRPGQLPMMVMELAKGCVASELEDATEKRDEIWAQMEATQQQADAAAAANTDVASMSDNVTRARPAAPPGSGVLPAPRPPPPPPGFEPLPAASPRPCPPPPGFHALPAAPRPPLPPPGFAPLLASPPVPASAPASAATSAAEDPLLPSVRVARAPPGFPVPGTASAPRCRDVWEDVALLPLKQVLAILVSLAAAIKAMHRVGLVHNDVKPANMLHRADDTYCLADFGLAEQLSPADPTGTFFFEMACGTRHYMAPEVQSNVPLTAAVDVYSFGITALCVAVTGSNSAAADWFAQQSWWPAGDAPAAARAFPAGIFPSYLPLSLELLLLDCVAWDPQERPTAEQVVQRLAAIWEEVVVCGY
ncbi:hypothetical protein CHLRE_11g467589v5 [Chlamydomonas reinhardtii]|uniref:Protein kinase domain-containing protein n=1 Tax=Chlamydomonas reinhardtii TaxID=3055 RepID=A0A2K3D7D1_CHLRE|nr:uncharacterized protein CHLRE_11g467589v5 [Chlamydomonas reinhardtii]PNW76442.1 hypothetical protein CHLRE_11g467589v5 [Chlamydomonas reinhardtii]